MICDWCESNILPNTKIYKGFDCTFCSSYCRTQIKNKNFIYDNRLSDYRKWYKYKPPPDYVECTPKRTQSIIDFQNRHNIEYKINLSKINLDKDNSNNICNKMFYNIYDYSQNYLNVINKLKFLNFIYKILYIKII